MIEDVLINIGYDNLEAPNLSNLDIEAPWLLDIKSSTKKYLLFTQVHNLLPNYLNTFNKNTVDYYYNNEDNFIYPITIYNDNLFKKYDTIEFDSKLLKSVKNKKAKIVFFYLTEGDWGTESIHFDWIDNLSIRYGFNKEDILFVNANLKSSENYKGNKFTIIPYNFFGISLDFVLLDKSNRNDLKLYQNKYIKYINNNKSLKKNIHFLCFNGIPRLHRLLIFGELSTNKALKNKYITSLRNTSEENSKKFYDEVLTNSNNEAIINFFKNYNSLQNYSYDREIWDRQFAWGASINEEAHTNSFVNIVTETMYNTESIFFSEKTYKPIYMCQPFILFGNPYSLKKLKELGFKTFDKWWDESYDIETDLNLRLQKITKVLEEIANWDFDKCFDVTNQMEEILIHNYKQLMSKDELVKLYSYLQTDIKQIKKTLL